MKNTTRQLILTQEVWHGYTRPAGTIVTTCESPVKDEDDSILDDCGCRSLWVRDPQGKVMNVWECDVAEMEVK